MLAAVSPSKHDRSHRDGTARTAVDTSRPLGDRHQVVLKQQLFAPEAAIIAYGGTHWTIGLRIDSILCHPVLTSILCRGAPLPGRPSFLESNIVTDQWIIGTIRSEYPIGCHCRNHRSASYTDIGENFPLSPENPWSPVKRARGSLMSGVSRAHCPPDAHSGTGCPVRSVRESCAGSGS